MVADDRKRTLQVVYKALAALEELWERAPVCDGSDVELDRVIAGPVLAAESCLLRARASLTRLVNERAES